MPERQPRGPRSRLRDTLDSDVAKRSPILGYNHNVRYRGLVFHVQTEDSGLLSPHLFTHLFYGGVIISTRKLVYDAGAAEEAIKSLMQAQHKAVLKDLKKGSFDDKIDQYLDGTPGLLARGSDPGGGDDAGDRPSKPAATPPAGTPAADATLVPKPPVVPQNVPAPAVEPPTSRLPTEAELPAYELAPPGSPAATVARTKTAQRTSAPSQVRTNLPPPPPVLDELGGPTLNDDEAASIAAAIAAANAVPDRIGAPDAPTIPVEMPAEAPLEIELELDEPDDDELVRARPRDTLVTELGEQSRAAKPESIPPQSNAYPRASSSVGAAALPPKPPRLPSRPQVAPPVARALGADRSGPVTMPPELPAEGERPGQYAQHKRVSQKVPVIDAVKERSGSTSIPPGLGRPGRASQTPANTTANAAPRPAGPRPASGAHPVVSPVSASGRSRPPTPSRATSPVGSPTVPSPSRTASASGGVVMTRPAVIVGAPVKPAQPQRVRKAREDEGRGFGQGLISEKSLDEVILAYLSEDADEK